MLWFDSTNAMPPGRGRPSHRSSVSWLPKAPPTSESEALLASPDLPDLVHQIASDLLEQIDRLNEKIGEIDNRIKALAKENEDSKRLMSIPGVGPLTASAIHAFAPPMENFRSGRDFAAWLGPREDSTGGKVRLGRITKMGQLRRVLITGAMSVVR